jgi:hypothetical protein
LARAKNTSRAEARKRTRDIERAQLVTEDEQDTDDLDELSHQADVLASRPELPLNADFSGAVCSKVCVFLGMLCSNADLTPPTSSELADNKEHEWHASGNTTDRAVVDDWIAGVVARHGRVDVLSNNVGVSRTGKTPLSMYLGYLMNHTSIIEQKARMGQGDAVVHISAGNLGQLNLRLPLFAEQTVITTVLSGMDAEIAALEARLDKTRALKQGMMQELLTGKTRLV